MIDTLSEHQIIKRIRDQFYSRNDLLVQGIGDDCAIFGSKDKGLWLISTDTLVDSIHFDRSFHPPKLLGRKCVAVNLSDIAAMGGTPLFILLSISLPGDVSSSWLNEWFDGVTEIVKEYNCCLIGGDTVQAKELSITVTVLGEPGPGGVIYRSGAGLNDTVYVSGFLGDSGAGLELLQHHSVKPQNKKWAQLLKAHLDPVPQIELGNQLALSDFVTSLQDISDGLATDLSHICLESGLGAVLSQISLPRSSQLEEAAKIVNKDPLDLQLFSGEDYQLVFTVQQNRESQVEAMIASALNLPIYPVGRIKKGAGVYLQKTNGDWVDITFKGYEHTMTRT